ncbi:MAG: alkaline phosphatase [Chthoniobacterales bacterium]
MKWRNQLLALFCLVIFFAFGVFYFRYWVVQKPFGIILFVGEGLAPDRLALARIYAGGVDKALRIESLNYNALLKNYSGDSAIPDAASAATALATGVKANNGAIGIDSAGKALKNLLELARDHGRMTGLITDGRLTSPTAAGFYAHAANLDRQKFARVLVEKTNVDVILGGGAEDFLPPGKGGTREDDQDLLIAATTAGYDLVRTRDQLDAVPRWREAKLFGVFASAELGFIQEGTDEGTQPNLADMVRRGIELLQFNSGGYLLVVDAGLMRKAAQENDAPQTLAETVEFDRAVGVALEYAGNNSSIFVCGDFAGPRLGLSGSPPRNLNRTDLFGLNPAGEPWLEWTTRSDENHSGRLTSEEAPPESGSFAKSDSRETAESTLPISAASQGSPSDVIAFGTGLGADGLRGTIETTALFEIIRDNL